MSLVASSVMITLSIRKILMRLYCIQQVSFSFAGNDLTSLSGFLYQSQTVYSRRTLRVQDIDGKCLSTLVQLELHVQRDMLYRNDVTKRQHLSHIKYRLQ